MLLAMRLASSRLSALATPAMPHIGIAIDISDGLSVGVYDLEGCVYGFNCPWRREPSHFWSSTCMNRNGHDLTHHRSEVEGLGAKLKSVGANALPFTLGLQFHLNRDWSYQFVPMSFWNNEPVAGGPGLLWHKPRTLEMESPSSTDHNC
jgi:hypothetical protein